MLDECCIYGSLLASMQGAFPPPTGAESTWSLVEEDALYVNRAQAFGSKRPSQSGTRAGGPSASDAALDSGDAAMFDSNSSLKYRYFALCNSIINHHRHFRTTRAITCQRYSESYLLISQYCRYVSFMIIWTLFECFSLFPLRKLKDSFCICNYSTSFWSSCMEHANEATSS